MRKCSTLELTDDCLHNLSYQEGLRGTSGISYLKTRGVPSKMEVVVHVSCLKMSVTLAGASSS